MILQLTEDRKFLQITSCTQGEYDQYKLSLTKRIDSWRWHPLVKKGIWNGEISYIKGSKIPSGLWKECQEIADEYKFDISIKGINVLFNPDFVEDDFLKWCDDFFSNTDKKPRDYQLESCIKILKYRRCLSELATASGKSMILFICLAYILEMKWASRVLLIVPNVSLVLQMTEDFDDYNQDKLKLKIQQIYAGSKIKKSNNIVIGTYQSLVKKDQEYYKDFDAVAIDETHTAGTAVSVQKILEKLSHCDYRFGVSGTIPKKGTINRLTLMSVTGPVITKIGADYLIKKGHITPCEVKILKLDYATEAQKEAFKFLSKTPEDRKKLFNLEQNFIIESVKRRNFITDIMSKVKKNSLVLFYRIEHGQAIYNDLREKSENEVYYIDGSTDKNVRDAYKKKMEDGEGRILVASFGTFSTGINITALHNIFLVESFKSEIIIRQSIGRGLRKHLLKNKLTLVDFVDDFGIDKFRNYLLRHCDARILIYNEQNFPYEIRTFRF